MVDRVTSEQWVVSWNCFEVRANSDLQMQVSAALSQHTKLNHIMSDVDFHCYVDIHF